MEQSNSQILNQSNLIFRFSRIQLNQFTEIFEFSLSLSLSLYLSLWPSASLSLSLSLLITRCVFAACCPPTFWRSNFTNLVNSINFKKLDPFINEEISKTLQKLSSFLYFMPLNTVVEIWRFRLFQKLEQIQEKFRLIQ